MAALQRLQSFVTSPPDLQLHLVVDGDEDFNECHGAGSRRPSTTSLSRFRSCPQLASLTSTSQDSPCSDMAPITDNEGNIIHTTPILRNSLFVDILVPGSGGIRSSTSTPTPPSTPGSRRKDYMTSSYHSKSYTLSNGDSPKSTSKLPRQPSTGHISGTMICSMDSQGEHMEDLTRTEDLQGYCGFYARDTDSPVNLRSDDFHGPTLDDERVSDTDDSSSMHLSGRFVSHADHRRYRNYFHSGPEDDNVDKCSRWLQSLKLNKSDKIKSRSHIQLPPV